ncbi:hypothetical protein FGO68_gene2484 [Halteria grandinella]|uniref:Calmodulin n=1 Tax=Halteria grandinella TaxID=5974 RepID=A0A8J8NHF9_HALGN|nr:hypothetical protein FGO68_gene2484 [Halteria grandinella]
MLNEVQIAEIREIFTLFDKNSDGYVNTSELGTMVRGLNFNSSDAEVNEMIKEVDPNGIGQFDQNSLISLIARRPKVNETLEDMIEALKLISDQQDERDRDKAKLTLAQFKLILMSLGEKMSEHQIDEILTDSDIVHEETIQIEEFAKYLMSR